MSVTISDWELVNDSHQPIDFTGRVEVWSGEFGSSARRHPFVIEVSRANNEYRFKPRNGTVHEFTDWIPMDAVAEAVLDEDVDEFEWDFQE